jgi:TrkA domain protein
MSEITETELPGIGKRFKLNLRKGGALTVVVRLDGERDVYFREVEEAEPSVFSMTELEAREVSSILVGTYYKLSPLEMFEEAMEHKAGLHSVNVPRSASVAGATIGDLDIRKRTEASIVAIVRDDGTSIPNPDPSTTIEKDDVLVVIGTVGAADRLKALLVE